MKKKTVNNNKNSTIRENVDKSMKKNLHNFRCIRRYACLHIVIEFLPPSIWSPSFCSFEHMIWVSKNLFPLQIIALVFVSCQQFHWKQIVCYVDICISNFHKKFIIKKNYYRIDIVDNEWHFDSIVMHFHLNFSSRWIAFEPNVFFHRFSQKDITIEIETKIKS